MPYNPWSSDWGTALTQAGAALASSSNPAQAQALQQMARGNQLNLTEQQKLAIQQAQFAQNLQLRQQEANQNRYNIERLPDGSTAITDKLNPNNRQIIPPTSVEMQSVPGFLGTRREPRFVPNTPNGVPGAPSGAPGAASAGGAGISDEDFFKSMDEVDQAVAAGKPIEERYAKIPSIIRPAVQARIEGRQPAAHYSRSADFRNAVDLAAQHAEPNADFTTFAARQRERSDFAGNSPQSLGGQLESLDAVTRHGHELNDAYDALFKAHPNVTGRNVVAWNAVQNKWDNAVGYPEVNRIVDILNSYSGEKARYLTGKAPSDEARHEATAAFATSNSPDAIKAAIAADGRLLRDKYEGHEKRWQGIMGEHVPMPVEGGLVSKRARDDMDYLIALDPAFRQPSATSPGVSTPTVRGKNQAQATGTPYKGVTKIEVIPQAAGQ